MKIASVTLAGPGSEAIVGDALRSATWCDFHVILDTHPDPSPNGMGNAALAASNAAGPNHVVVGCPWSDDFAAMRNETLAIAAQERFGLVGKVLENQTPDWAIWLDTDERLICPDPKALRDTLAAFPQVDAVSAPHASGAYHKDRMLRLPARGRYVGPVHEYFVQNDENPVLRVGPDLLAFDELPDDPDTKRAKLERDERILRAYVKTHRDEARWKHYLGHTLANMGERAEAVAWWTQAMNTEDETNLEVRGWAAFRAAESRLVADPEHAVSLALRGLRVYPASPELLWVLAAAHLNLGKPRHALHWAHLCLAAGDLGGGPKWERSGFRHPPAWTTAPFEVSALAAEAMGDRATAQKAREMIERVKDRR